MKAARHILAIGILVAIILGISPKIAHAQDPVAAYPTRLVLHGPIEAGAGQTITGEGAPPTASQIFVELWRVPHGTRRAQSIMTVEAQSQGHFAFPGVDVAEGDQLFVTLSGSWDFDTDGDLQGWDADISPDADLEVSGGTLKVRVSDGNLDGFLDPYFMKLFNYSPSYYRVVEVRLRVTGAPSVNNLMVFWGQPWPNQIRYHRATTPGDMSGFETILMPMNVNENRATPYAETNVDNLWMGSTHSALRLCPTNPPGTFDPSGLLVEIDSIRIREDFRLDFHGDGDFMGVASGENVQGLSVADGFLTYNSTGDSSVGLDIFNAGWFETSFQSQFVLGMSNGQTLTGASTAGLLFPADSAELAVNLAGRQDVFEFVDMMTPSGNGWSGSFEVDAVDLRVLLPEIADPSETVRIDYVGLVPTDPFGPSVAEYVEPTNTPPNAVVTSVPDPAVVQLADGSASITLDGSGSDDGDGGAQGLSFEWSQTSGPAVASFDSMSAMAPVVSFSVAGDYEFELTVDDGDVFYSSASATIAVTVEEEVIEEPEPTDVVFLRGDVDADGRSMELGDSVKLLKFIFFPRRWKPACPDAADVDDSGRISIRDSVLILRYFFGVRRLPEEYGACNPDATEDSLPECEYPEDLCVDATVKHRPRWRESDKHSRKCDRREAKAKKKAEKKAEKEARKSRRASKKKRGR